MTAPVPRPASVSSHISPAAAVLAYAALVLLMRAYRGVFQDGRIYIGRALADLDPGGVGRDVMYAYDAQTGFSLFPKAVTALTAAAGPAAASILLTLLGLALWGAAALLLARRLAPGRDGWAAAAAMLALPAAYGAYFNFSYAEPWASPRIFSEGLVLLGLVLVLDDRRIAAAAAMLAAAALHPLMALPGAAVMAVAMALQDRRWAWLFPAGAAAAIGAAAAGLPVAERLLRPMDPAWLQILQLRSAYLFPVLWPIEDWARLLVQGSTLLLAARFLTEAPRRLMLAAAIAGAAGVLLAASAAVFPSELLLQLQPWRTTWLAALLGNAALPLALVALWRAGGVQRVIMAVLVCAWLNQEAPAGAVAALLALALGLRFAGRPMPVSDLAMKVALAATGVMALAWVLRRAAGLAQFIAVAGESGAPVSWPLLLAADLHALVIVGVLAAWALRPSAPLSNPARLASFGAAAVVFLIAAWAWDARTPFRRWLEAGHARPSFEAAAGPIDGSIYWSDGDVTPWFAAGQAAWFNPMQGGPMLFSRDLAVLLDARVERLIALGLDRPQSRAPFLARMDAKPAVQGSAASVAALCGGPDAPAAVVLNGRQPQAVPPGLRAAEWASPYPEYILWDPTRLAWRRVDAYTVIRCR